MFARLTTRLRGIVDAANTRIADVRERFAWIDHCGRALERYQDVNAGRLAAALTYTTFLAFFPLLLVGYSILGVVLNHNQGLTERVTRYLEANIPTLDAGAIADASLPVGIIGVVALLITGVNWVSEIRGVMRVMWLRETPPANPSEFLGAKLVDAVVLLGLGLLLGASVFASFFASDRINGLLSALDAGWKTLAVSSILGIAVNYVLCFALLVGVPRISVRLRTIWVPVLLGAVGLEAIKFGAGWLLTAPTNPAYVVVATSVGLLIFFNLSNRLLLWCAALAATGGGHPPATREPAYVLVAGES